MKKKSISVKAIAGVLTVTTIVASANPIGVSAASKPAWKATKSSMTVGDKTKFTIKNKPKGGTVTFSSSKKSVATIGKTTGKVTAKKAGKTVIKAVVKNKKKKKVKTLTKKLTVKAKVTPTTTPTTVPTATPGTTVTNPTMVPTTEPTLAPTATPVVSNNNKNWAIVIDAKQTAITADGGDNTVLTFKIINTTTQQVDDTATDITLGVTSSFGELSNDSVTIKKGVGTLVLNSEFSAKELDCEVNAEIIRQSSNATDLVGQLKGQTHVTFEPFEIAEDTTPKLVKAESDQADRVTLFFDREVSIDDFIAKNEATGTYMVKEKNGILRQVFLNTTTTSPVFTVTQEDVNGKKASYPVVGFAEVKADDGTRVNKKALQLMIAESSYLDDNNIVTVTYKNNACGLNTTVSFKLTDAKKPQLTAVDSVGMKKVELTFSEAIPEIKNVSGAAFTINGSAYTVGNSDYGVYNPVTAEDGRSHVMLTLGKDNKGNQQYFKAGEARISITNVMDYAGITDEGRNIISNQDMSFDVEDDANIPTAKVTVESPEQYRIKFTGDKNGNACPVAFLDENGKATSALEFFTKSFAVKVGNKYIPMFTAIYTLNDKVELGTDEEQKVIPELDKTLKKFFNITKISDSEYVVELTQDWTRFYNTNLGKKTNRNYYNDKFQFVFAEESVYNDNNGLKNKDAIVLDLNYTGSPLNTADDLSPEVTDILKTEDDIYFAAKMSEPVQFTTTGGSTANITLSEEQTAQPVKVEFKGTDENGEPVTLKGSAVGYYDDGTKSDTMLKLKAVHTLVENGKNVNYTIQELVDQKGYGTSWSLALTYVYDDVKNAAPTKVIDFTVDRTVGSFYITDIKGYAATTTAQGTVNDLIIVTFSQGISDTSKAIQLKSWKLDGYKFSEDSNVELETASGTIKTGYTTIKFILPKGTLRKNKSHMLNVDKGIESIKGNVLIGEYENKFVAQ